MLLRILIAIVAIGAMGLAALAQTPEQNEASRKATAERLIEGEKGCSGCDLFQVDLSYQEFSGIDLSSVAGLADPISRPPSSTMPTFPGRTSRRPKG